MFITKVDFIDLEQILKLQYLAYQSEARLHNNYSIPPLVQTIEEVQKEFQDGIILKATDDAGVIIGSVRGYTKDNTLYIGKLIVHPEYQGRGISTKLMQMIEGEYPNHRYELFTSDKSVKNLAIYEHLGYSIFKEILVTPQLKLIYLEKNTK